MYGLTDNPNDGGIDAIYFLVNKELVTEDSDLSDLNASTADLIFVQVKDSAKGFKPTEIDKLLILTDDFLDLSEPVTQEAFHAKYNTEILRAMSIFKDKYADVASSLPQVTIHYYYITKGDEESPNKSAQQSADRVCAKAREHFNKAACEFQFVNLQKLLSYIQQRPPKTRTLRWSDTVHVENGHIGLVNLVHLYEFIRDDDGTLSSQIFEANVRGWQQNTRVNKDITKTLRAREDVDFWLLNNGITILASRADTEGKNRLTIQDPQVVNGLQTSRAIYSYFADGADPEQEHRSVLVRVIQTEDPQVYGAIVKATNSQNQMPQASLRAHEKIQVQIDELFQQYGLFYDRRKGYYKDSGKPIKKIVSMNELLQAMLAVLMQRPDDARARPGDYWSKDEKYQEVFTEEDRTLTVFLRCVEIMRRVNQFLAGKPIERGDVTNIKFYLGSLATRKLVEPSTVNVSSVVKCKATDITDDMMENCFQQVWEEYKSLGGDDAAAKGVKLVRALSA